METAWLFSVTAHVNRSSLDSWLGVEKLPMENKLDCPLACYVRRYISQRESSVGWAVLLWPYEMALPLVTVTLLPFTLRASALDFDAYLAATGVGGVNHW